MVSIPKIIGVISCGVVLSLSLANATQAFQSNPCASRKGGLPNLTMCSEEKQHGIQTIKGEVLRVDGDTLFIQRFNGQQMLLHLDPTVKNGSVIERGDRIEVKMAVVDYEDRVLSIREIN